MMAQQLRVLPALREGLGSVPYTHTAAQTAWKFSSSEVNTPFECRGNI